MKKNHVKHLDTLQAKWGYVAPSVYKDNKNEVVDKILNVLGD